MIFKVWLCDAIHRTQYRNLLLLLLNRPGINIRCRDPVSVTFGKFVSDATISGNWANNDKLSETT